MAAEPEPVPVADSKRRWLVPAGIGMAVVVAAVGATLLTLRTVAKPAAVPAPVTVTSVAPPPVPASPTYSPVEMVQADVKVSMQKKLDSDPDLKRLRLKVVDVMLVHKDGNEYKGIAHVRSKDGVVHDVPVEVTSDERNTMWETPPGSLDFAQDEPSPPPPVAAPPVSSPGETFKICPSGVTGVASADTSCAFADNVRSSWYASPGSAINAYSPVTDQSYLMRCVATATDIWPTATRCAGTNAQGTVLVVYFD
ncbi:hypothetical protein [Mycobacterium sp. shizuoka-1]|uniref:hypothetical protein n=1 Tax=Mycobacterium sp. shizuoka-1 TaxID=2039281 RepID=UPI001E380E21|nr:hypothetical protein [Mycobacterium sp. shizuoka-1]